MKGIRHVRRSNAEIMRWANYYIVVGTPIMRLEKELEVPHSTLWWCFTHRLQGIDESMYDEVVQRIGINKKNKTRKEELNMENTWYMANVVWYDGSSAFVSKFIVQCDIINGELGYTDESRRKIQDLLDGRGEIVKIDLLNLVNFDDIIALKDCSDQPELQRAYECFKEMWF